MYIHASLSWVSIVDFTLAGLWILLWIKIGLLLISLKPFLFFLKGYFLSPEYPDVFAHPTTPNGLFCPQRA